MSNTISDFDAQYVSAAVLSAVQTIVDAVTAQLTTINDDVTAQLTTINAVTAQLTTINGDVTTLKALNDWPSDGNTAATSITNATAAIAVLVTEADATIAQIKAALAGTL